MNCFDGTYKGPTCQDDQRGPMYWNATEQLYEVRTGYTNSDGKISYNLDGKGGGYDLPANWFNDSYNALTGKFTSNTWKYIAIGAVAAIVLYIIIKKM